MNNEPGLAKWLRWLVYASALVPLVIFSQYMSPFHFGKVIVLRSIVQVMVVLYLLLIWRDRSYLPKSHPILWAFVAFTAAFTITSITSIAPIQSYWGTLERMGGLFTFWHYLAFFIISVSVMRTRRDWQLLLDTMVVVGICSAIYGFLQKTDWSFILGSGNRNRIFGTIGNAALFAGYQILVAFLALTMSFLQKTTRNWRIWYWVASAVMFFAAAMTAVRGSLIGITVGLLAVSLLWTTLYRSKRAKMFLLGGLSVLVVFIFLAVLLRETPIVKNSPYLSRVTDFSSSTYTVQTRFWAWSAGFKGWSETPKTVVLGWGPENFNIPFSKYFNPKFFAGPGSETFFDRAHNMFVEVLVTMGLLGLIAYISIFAALFWTLSKMMRSPGDGRIIGIGFTAMTIAYIIHNCFIFDTSANFLTFFILLAFAMHLALEGSDVVADKQRAVVKARAKPWTVGQMSGALVLGIIVTMTIYSTNVRPTLANYASTRAIIAGWQGDWTGAVNKYREAIDYDTPGRYEFRHRFAQYLLELSGSADVSKVPNFKDVVLQAITDVQNNVAENPQDYLPYLYLSRLYITLGKDDYKSPYNDLALKESTAALQISPTFVRTYYEVAQAYLNKGDAPTAFTWFEKAAQLQPDVGVTFWYMGSVRYQIAAAQNDLKGIKEALGYFDTALAKGYGLSEADGNKLVQIYLKLGDSKSAAAVLENLVSSFPTKKDYWAQLVNTYIGMNSKDKIVDAIRRALAIPQVAADTDFKAKADAVLNSFGLQP